MTSTPEGFLATPPDAGTQTQLPFNAPRRRLIGVVAAIVVVIEAISFMLSFDSQMELAVRAQIPAAIAFGLPLIVDGTILVSTFAAALLRPRGRRVVWYPWAVLILFGSISIWSNGIHATAQHLTQGELFSVGAIPAVSLLLSTHLLVLMIGHGTRRAIPVAVTARPAETPATPAPVEPIAIHPVPSPTYAPAPTTPAVSPVTAVPALAPAAVTPTAHASAPSAPASVAKAAGRALTRQEVTDRISAANTNGQPVTGADVAEWMQLSEVRGSAILNQIQATLNAGQDTA